MCVPCKIIRNAEMAAFASGGDVPSSVSAAVERIVAAGGELGEFSDKELNALSRADMAYSESLVKALAKWRRAYGEVLDKKMEANGG